jgi:hypothetical protein
MPRLPDFPAEPTPATVGNYLAALMDAESEGYLDDDDWLDGLAAVRDWLQAWPLGWMKNPDAALQEPDEEEEAALRRAD